MFRIITAFLLGVRDGYQQGELTFGLTFDDNPESPRSCAYDRGATLGERLRAIRFGLSNKG